jgi:hypothetical protein
LHPFPPSLGICSAYSDLAQALDSNSNPHQALAPKDFLSEWLCPFHHPKGSHRRGITAASFLNRGSYSAGGHEFYLSSIFGVDFRFISNAKSRDLFGKGVQEIPLPEREVSSHLLLFPKKLR